MLGVSLALYPLSCCDVVSRGPAKSVNTRYLGIMACWENVSLCRYRLNGKTEPVIMTPQAACSRLTLKGTLQVKYQSQARA